MNIFWRRTTGGNFDTAFDWSTDSVPTFHDDAVIGAPGTYTVSVTTNHVIHSLRTISTVTLAVNHSTLSISNGVNNAGTIMVGDGATLAVGGAVDNSGEIELDSLFLATDLTIDSNVTLTGGGRILLDGGAHDAIVGARRFPFPFLPPFTLTNVNNTIVGFGTIGGTSLALDNRGTIDGDGRTASLTISTGTHLIRNSGLMEGTRAGGLVIVNDVANNGQLEAVGPAARLVLDGVVTDTGKGSVTASGDGAHVDLSSAAIRNGTVTIGSGALLQSGTGTGASVISGATVGGAGILQANRDSTLSLAGGSIGSGLSLISDGTGAVLSVNETVGALPGQINGGEIAFSGPSAANITFGQGLVGTLKITSAFTGTVSGLAGNQPVSFTGFFAFGDSTIDTGALQYLSTYLPSPPNPGLTARLKSALANGGTDSPVGVGTMNSQLLAADFGLAANTAYTTNGAVGGGGTNYAIAGALNATDAGNGGDPGNGGISNINQHGTVPNPQLLSTVAQLETYLASVGGVADPSALYLISSGGNDASFASRFLSQGQQQPYLDAQAQALTTEIVKLFHAGAEHILVNPSMGDGANAIYYSQKLFADLDASGISYTKSDVFAMEEDVIANPTAYGFTPDTVQRGVDGLITQSALIEPDTVKNLSGWGLWGANATTPDTSDSRTNFQYAYLASPDAEQTHFFADDQHLSAAGQQIQANLDQNLLTDDAIDISDLAYTYGMTTASFSGDATGGTLTVSNGTQQLNISLLGNYLASTFMTASDGTGATPGTLVLDHVSPQLLAVTNG